MRHLIRTLLATLVATLATSACAQQPDRGPGSAAVADTTLASDPRAIAVADRVMQALGGKANWDAVRGLRWSFESARNDTILSTRLHSWDKRTGMHRVSGVTRDGVPFTFVDHLVTGAGQAWMANAALEGDTVRALMKRAKSLWTNDSYWLLMPYKLRDPGVILKHEGAVREGDYLYDKLALSFANVGETPGDRYWVYVSQATGRPEKWEYVLEGQEPPAVAWTWEGWEQHGGLWFATTKRNAEGRAIHTRRIEIVDEFPAAEFQGP